MVSVVVVVVFLVGMVVGMVMVVRRVPFLNILKVENMLFFTLP